MVDCVVVNLRSLLQKAHCLVFVSCSCGINAKSKSLYALRVCLYIRMGVTRVSFS